VVLRGKYVLENILGTPPPPPPPDVPALDEAAVGTSASLRQQMEAHRASPICASCHSKMDVLGFGLENYDAIGAWRTADGKFPVDATGTLPNGKSFATPAEFRRLLLANLPEFEHCLSQKMLTYALGRGLGPSRPRYGIGNRPQGDSIRLPLPGIDPRSCSQHAVPDAARGNHFKIRSVTRPKEVASK
jgi:hypothetical protein